MGRPPEDIATGFGEQADWFSAALGQDCPPLRVWQAQQEAQLPSPDLFCGAIISGSWAMVTEREPWSERVADWLRQALAQAVPLLGVCYGHQLMAHAFGGEVAYHPEGAEVGTHRVSLRAPAEDDPLLQAFPPDFAARLTHSQSVRRLPPGAHCLASSRHDAHQMVRYAPHAVSVQFHPEFSAALIAACVRRRTQAGEPGVLPRDGALALDTPTPWATKVLHRFVEHSVRTPRRP